MFSRRQPADNFNQISARELSCVVNSLPENQLRQNRTADERGRAAIREIPRSLDTTIIHDQRQTQPIAANRVRLFHDARCFRQLAGVARMRQVIFKGSRVRHAD